MKDARLIRDNPEHVKDAIDYCKIIIEKKITMKAMAEKAGISPALMYSRIALVQYHDFQLWEKAKEVSNDAKKEINRNNIKNICAEQSKRRFNARK